jgi:hypothetical protein
MPALLAAMRAMAITLPVGPHTTLPRPQAPCAMRHAMDTDRPADRPAASSGERSPESKSKQGHIGRNLRKLQAGTGARWSPCPLPVARSWPLAPPLPPLRLATSSKSVPGKGRRRRRRRRQDRREDRRRAPWYLIPAASHSSRVLVPPSTTEQCYTSTMVLLV